MTFYQTEIIRIKNALYANKGQLNTVIGVRHYIGNNYNADLSLNLLSHTKFVSKYHLLRLFKKYYGQTPKQFLIDKRVEKSKEHLKKGLNVSETCYAVGFESPCSFTTFFKSKTGLTPTEFQKKQFSQSLSHSDAETLQH